MNETAAPRLGPYLLSEPLGQGGMAQVWGATHAKFGFAAAVKVVVADAATQDFFLDTIFAEARSHAGLEHPRVIRLLDYGHVEPEDVAPSGVTSGHPYLVMERADGTLREQMPATFPQVRNILLEVLDALAYSHARGVLHRDLKPENILLVEGPGGLRHKLADFGIAHPAQLDETYDRETVHASVGTPAYMPPEQLRGATQEFGPWTDLYALGCMTFEMVAGRPPFDAESVMGLALQHMNAPVPRLEPRFEVPEQFGAWVARLLAKDPRERFRWAADAAHSLVELCRDFEPRMPSGDAGGVGESSEEPTDVLDHVYEMTTLVDVVDDEFASGPTVDAADVVTMAVEATEVDQVSVPPIAYAPAPMPDRWESARVQTAIGAEGLGLFALRRPPVVGQADVRKPLWEELQAVRQSGSLRTVVVRGDRGAPTTEVCEWLSVRAREVGAAPTLRIFHTRAGGPREGLVGLAEDFFSLWPLASSRVAERIEQVLAERVPAELLHAEVEALTAEVLTARGDDAPSRAVPSRRDRYRMLSRAVEISTASRPVIVFVENAQWGSDALAFVDYLAERHGDRPVLVVVSVSDEEVDEDSSVARALHGIEASARTLHVGRYDATEQGALVDELLALEPRSRTRVVEATVGDRVFAQSLLADFIDREQLEATSDGFRLHSVAVIPDDAGALFERRIARLARLLGGDAEAVLEVAGILGRAPEPTELAAVCAELGLSIPDDFDGALVESGLAISRGHRWWFIHDACVQRLRQRAEAAGRARGWHLACAAVLERRSGPEQPEMSLRLADHFQAAGELRRSLKPRLGAAHVIRRTDAPLAARLVEECRDIIETLGLSPDAPEAIEVDCVAAHIAAIEGDVSRSRALAERAEQAAQGTPHRDLLALALRAQAGADIDSGAFREAAGRYAEAERIANDLGAIKDAASAAFGAGYAAYAQADYDKAAECYRRAVQRYEQIGRQDQAASVHSYLSGLYLAREQFDEARRHSELALEAGRRLGNVNLIAEAAAGLGEIARYRGAFDEAEERYLEAKYWFELSGHERQRGTIFNLALTWMAQGRWREALGSFDSLTFEGPRAAMVLVARATCELCLGNTSRFDRLLEEATAMWGDEATYRDFAWILERASRLARDSDPVRATRVDTILLGQYERLDDESRAEEVRARLRESQSG